MAELPTAENNRMIAKSTITRMEVVFWFIPFPPFTGSSSSIAKMDGQRRLCPCQLPKRLHCLHGCVLCNRVFSLQGKGKVYWGTWVGGDTSRKGEETKRRTQNGRGQHGLEINRTFAERNPHRGPSGKSARQHPIRPAAFESGGRGHRCRGGSPSRFSAIGIQGVCRGSKTGQGE